MTFERTNKKVLVVEDDAFTGMIIKQVLSGAGYQVDLMTDGALALEAFMKKQYDALLTDWIMPNMDGIELIRRVRESGRPLPVIMVITTLSSAEARGHALKSGADDYISKPFQPNDIIKHLDTLFSRKFQPAPASLSHITAPKVEKPRFVAVGIAASTGGPMALNDVVARLTPTSDAVYFIVQHAPAWALEAMVARWNKLTPMHVAFAETGMPIEGGGIYVAPKERHLAIHPDRGSLMLLDDPPENFVRPSADPLFRSIATRFGKWSIGVVLTGMGRDGVRGAQYIRGVGGRIIVQDPKTAVAPSMPASTMDAVDGAAACSIHDVPSRMEKAIMELMGVRTIAKNPVETA